MTQALSNTAAPQPSGKPNGTPAPERWMPRSWIGQIALRALGRWGAVIGLVWVGVLAFFAVFAPLIASSHPLWMVDAEGVASSPMLDNLTRVDVVLLAALLSAGLLWVPGISKRVHGKRKWLWLGAVVLAMGASWLWVNPPALVVLSEYREGLADGTIGTPTSSGIVS